MLVLADCILSNCANLAINFGWHGLFIDRNLAYIERGQKYYASHADTELFPPKFSCAIVRRENINQIIEEAGFSGEVDVLSIDIDGNDYWVLDAIEVVSPRIVIVEYNSVFGPSVAVTVPYDPVFDRSRVHYSNLYYGASLSALAHLMQSRGYALVGSNRAGNNAFFVRRDALGDIRETSPAECYVPSPFAESRDRSGALTYVRSMSARLELIGHLPVYDVLQDSVVPLKALT